jgi:hypothetical protein
MSPAANFAGIAVLVLSPTSRTYSTDVSVRQEHLAVFTKGLLDTAFYYGALLVEGIKNAFAKLFVFRRVSRVIIIEADIKTLEIPQVFGIYFFNQLFGGDTGVAGANHNRRAVRIIGAKIQTAIAAQFLEPHPDIRLAIFDKMTYMDWGVCVW